MLLIHLKDRKCECIQTLFGFIKKGETNGQETVHYKETAHGHYSGPERTNGQRMTIIDKPCGLFQ